ncbi:alpha/beta fold hydrolase [Fictibacillus terranigra]|uniref:Alpha/beta fold hydrolase n=1 Tax=Fictibacillus terranigra TaxID=3058424 RepID=A0ABT8E8D5_9BACL|nr:alpha/beta fold hydrolase [Fictibacillus sp. CENA-BCM004]MDN4074150.1 alpha/beta fold hydrolase [Fictibacillus sp. CENA-BCM004]
MLTPQQQEAANKALENFDFRDDLHKITADTLVISGKYDGLNPPDDGKEVARLIPHADFVVFEKSGHAPSVEEPKQIPMYSTSF